MFMESGSLESLIFGRKSNLIIMIIMIIAMTILII